MPLPYQLENDPDTGLYFFITNNRIRYICRFKNVTNNLSPLLGIYDLEIFDFDFYPEIAGIDKLKFDGRVCATICDLFSKFFISDLRVLVYICDSSDGKQQARNILFDRWYVAHVSHLLSRIPVKINIGDDVIYGCALMTHRFPYTDVLHKELIEKIDGILIEKWL